MPKKKCPLQKKWYIPLKHLALEYRDCPFIAYCPLPWCVYEKTGRVSIIETEVLLADDLILGCPKCQPSITVADKVKMGMIESGLERCADGMVCRFCGLIVYKEKPLKERKKRKKKRSGKQLKEG